MPDNRFEETTSRSWFQRIKSSLGGIIFGVILFIASFPILFLNERRAVKTARSLQEMLSSVTSTNPDAIDPKLDGKLIHITGDLKTQTPIADSSFGISVPAIMIERKVMMYQWQEMRTSTSREKLGGTEETTTTYDYSKTWSDRTIDSTSFKHEKDHANPNSMPYESKLIAADDVLLGAFRIPASLLGYMENFVPLPATEADKDRIENPELKEKIKISDGKFYVGQDPHNPAIGDIKIEFSIIKPSTASIIAKQQNNTLESYRSKYGRVIEILYEGSLSAEQMIEKRLQENSTATWLIRLLGFLCMWLGLYLIVAPLSVFFAIIPILGNIAAAGLGLITCLLALAISLCVIAFGWFVYRPSLSVFLVMIASAISALIMYIRRRRLS